MKKIYFLYTFTALFTAWIITFYLGFSSGFADYLPVCALLGSLIMFVVANPLIIYYHRIGLYVGLLACLLLLPYNLILTYGIITNSIEKIKLSNMFITIPPVLVIVSTFLSVKTLFIQKPVTVVRRISNVSKIILTGIPIVLFITYVILYGKFWSWDMLPN